MSRALRPPAAVALAATVAVISAGCGGTGPAASDAGDKNATVRDQAVKFAECMRENGVSDFPDPKASGDFPSFGVSVSPAVWQEALGACKDLQPPGSLSAKRSPEQQSAALEFARCIRANGVEDFPDPVNGQPLVDTTRIPSSNKPGGMTVLNAAMRKCRGLVAAAVAGR